MSLKIPVTKPLHIRSVDVEKRRCRVTTFRFSCLPKISFHNAHDSRYLLPPFTHNIFQIDGPKETYLGTGDLHQAQYDHLGVHSTLLELNEFAIRGSKYTGAPVDKIFCPFTLHVYPSDDMYSQFSTNNGLIFALSAVAIFVFTSCKSAFLHLLLFELDSYIQPPHLSLFLGIVYIYVVVFILYDVYVEKRQKLVMNKAERSSAIVSSLFPSAVRDLLVVPKEAPKKPERKSRLTVSAFQNDHNDMRFENSDDDHENEPLTGSPIATLYENTTIMCELIAVPRAPCNRTTHVLTPFGLLVFLSKVADIAGFTHWSGSRQPTEVS